VTIASLHIGMLVRVRHMGIWYRAGVESIGRTRVTVWFQLKQAGRGLRRRTVRAEDLRPVQEE